QIQALHVSLTPFAPAISVKLLPYLAFVLLTASFLLAFYFTTIPKDLLTFREITVALWASILAGFGVIALFSSAGVYV
ncbi:uncharacterized protein EI90DRAFT_2973895, partial [Cantharellus anzutake]|uniref:uncharacterized protein n=1 Tax=Cantharellus anzutake TaxID=1750568 RepID=UPI0019053638